MMKQVVIIAPFEVPNSPVLSREDPPRQRSHRRLPMTSAPAFLVFLLLSWWSPSALAAGLPHLNQTLEAIVREELPPNFAVSILVADADTGRIIMQKDPDLPLIPASSMKVVTSWAALGVLKPDFTFVTEVLVDGVKGSSVGNIYLKGGGDPYLVSEQLFALTRDVRDTGLREVRGDIVVDDSHFIPGKPIDEQEDLGTRSYHAPYGALSLNFNTIKVLVHPGAQPGKPARIVADPVSEYATVKGSVNTVKGRAAAKITIDKESTRDGRDVIRVQGAIGADAPVKGRYANVSSPDLYTGYVFKEFLLREGIKVAGKVKRGRAPSSATSYLKFRSLPLGNIVYWLNKFSNNFMAEQICMELGAAVHGVPGTREKGLSVIRQRLRTLGLDEGTYVLREASGLSRGNRLSASVLVRVLLDAYHDFTCSGEFISSLGVAGTDGTLKEKFTDDRARRRIRAKTGTLRGVNALAGYGFSREGRVFVFAVLVNSLREGAGFIDYGDRIVRRLLDVPMNPH